MNLVNLRIKSFCLMSITFTDTTTETTFPATFAFIGTGAVTEPVTIVATENVLVNKIKDTRSTSCLNICIPIYGIIISNSI